MQKSTIFCTLNSALDPALDSALDPALDSALDPALDRTLKPALSFFFLKKLFFRLHVMIWNVTRQ